MLKKHLQERPYTDTVSDLGAPQVPRAEQTTLETAVLVPVKRFADAKDRLRSVLSQEERSALAESLATGVLRAADPLRVFVVCDDDEVARWAARLDASVIWSPQRGLNAAVSEGVARLAAEGFDWITIAHSDLPYPADLATLPEFEGVTIVPDRFDDGTNVLRIPSRSSFEFHYGRGSFAQHVKEANVRSLPVDVIRGTTLDFDVDDPADLELLRSRRVDGGPRAPIEHT